ncbi:alpha/beta hydrolase [Polaromonas sp. P1-6]|nr:alpha/beta hydrolase [Polaromonas sp. P1-6]
MTCVWTRHAHCASAACTSVANACAWAFGRPALGRTQRSGHRYCCSTALAPRWNSLHRCCSELDDREAIIFDVPGAGASPAPSWPCRPWQLARLARHVLDALGYGVVDVFGVSWGGGLAQQFAAQYPRRCRRLVLAATSMGGIMVPGKPSVLWQMISPRRYWDKDRLRRIAPQIYGGDLRHNHEALHGHAQAMRGGAGYGYVLQLLAMMGWSSLPLLWRIRQPTLVLAGSDDPRLPLVNARWLTRLLRHGRLEVIDCGHLFLVTRAAQTARLIDEFYPRSAKCSSQRARFGQPLASRLGDPRTPE